jgi:hypothetical protein
VAVVTLKLAPDLGHAFVLPEFKAMSMTMSTSSSAVRRCIRCVKTDGVTSSKVGGG